jgi:flagella basal body P-ring formation protein FlgA
MLRFLRLFSLIYWIATAAGAQAQDMLTGAELTDGLKNYLTEQGYPSALPALNDSRLFKPCTQPLAYKPLFGNYQTVEIRCPDPEGWKLAVRTKIGSFVRPQPEISAKSNPQNIMETAHIVTKQSLKRGHVITLSDLELVTKPAKGFSDYFTSAEALVGRKLTRNLAIGKMVRASYLESDWMITQGQPVMLVSQVGTVQVLSEGEALENAHWGELARFLNVRSGQIVFATVFSEKKVIIGAKRF